MIPNTVEAWGNFAFGFDDRSLGVRLAIAELIREAAAGATDANTRSYLIGIADSIVRPSRLRVERKEMVH